MLDEQQEAPEAEADDDAVDVSDAGGDDAVDVADAGGDDAVDVADAGGDDAIDLAEMGTPTETADEPAVQPDELLELADAPERWEGGEPKDTGPAETSEARAQEAADLGAQAASEGETPAPSDDQEASE
jgi:hypothetical protein